MQFVEKKLTMQGFVVNPGFGPTNEKEQWAPGEDTAAARWWQHHLSNSLQVRRGWDFLGFVKRHECCFTRLEPCELVLVFQPQLMFPMIVL